MSAEHGVGFELIVILFILLIIIGASFCNFGYGDYQSGCYYGGSWGC